MSKLRRFIILLCLIFATGLIYYFSLPSLKQNLIKRKVLHLSNILNPEWEKTIIQTDDEYVATFKSPTLLVDDIFTSMKGPYSYKTFVLNENEDELYWITGFEGKANSKYDTKNSSNDLICHINLYHSDVEHFMRMGLEKRINVQASQLITLTKGDLSVKFPKGFGYPLFSNEKILLGSQVLNLNYKNPLFTVNYDFKMHYQKNQEKRLKPLYMRYAVLALPYDPNRKTASTIYEDSNNMVRCVISDKDNHGQNSLDENGQPITAFWVVPKGKHTYKSNFTKFLALDTIETLHMINVHVHPFATSLNLRDATADSTIFRSIITNYSNKIGIEKMTSFSSIKGIKLYPDHEYLLFEEVNNTSDSEIEMMGSMFLYFFDQKLNQKLDSLSLN